MIYFDNASTTPLSDAAAEAYDHVSRRLYGNPSSPHAIGIAAERAVNEARRKLASWLSCLPDELLFTSGGTESNNLAIIGAALCFKRRGGHILTTPLEHPSVLSPVQYLAREGFRVTYAPPSEWEAHVGEDTRLVSFHHINNETGDIQDIDAIASRVKQRNPHTLVHVDGVQGFGKISASLAKVDLYSFSAHKIHGPKGMGGLMVRKGTRLVPLMYGGGQQNGMRPGTAHTAGIAAMLAAAEAAWLSQSANEAHVAAIKSILTELAREAAHVYENNQGGLVSPYILNMSFIGVKGETLTHWLSEQGIYIAMGAACRTHKQERSPLYALGYEEARVQSAVRFSFSPLNTLEEATTVKAAVLTAVHQLRSMHK